MLDAFTNFLRTGAPLAGLAAIASILAFFFRDRGGAGYWPDFAFFLLLLLTLVTLLYSFRLAKQLVDAQNHLFTTITVHNGQTYNANKHIGELIIESAQRAPKSFTLTVRGQISTPQMNRLTDHFNKKTLGSRHRKTTPLYILVTERSRAGRINLWWPHQGSLDLESNGPYGSYEAVCHLGGEEDPPENNQLFGIRVYIPKNLNENLKRQGGFFVDLKEFPPHIFLSDELPIKTIYPD